MNLLLIEQLPITWNFNHRLDGYKECSVRYKEFSSNSLITSPSSLKIDLIEREVSRGIGNLFKLIHKEPITRLKRFSRVPKEIEEYNWYFKDSTSNKVKIVRGELEKFVDNHGDIGMTMARHMLPSIFVTHIQVNGYQDHLSNLLFVEKLN